MLSRATRAARLLWREWWHDFGRDGLVGAAGVLAIAVALFGIGAVGRHFMPSLADQPRLAIGFLVVAAPFVVLCFIITVVGCTIDIVRALRSAWERAGREG